MIRRMEEVDTRHTPASLRALAGLSQTEVAARAQPPVSPGTVGNIESGDNVTIDALRAVAPALGVTFEVLVAAHAVVRDRRESASREKPRSVKPKRAKGAA